MFWGLAAGFVVGVIAKFIMRHHEPGGTILSALFGVGGAALGMLLGRFTGLYRYGEMSSLIASVAGAVLILVAYRLTFNRAQHSPRSSSGSSG